MPENSNTEFVLDLDQEVGGWRGGALGLDRIQVCVTFNKNVLPK